ncbi:hypothetical protein SAMN05216319_5086 [Duganella sp. CF402]|uniref:DUF6279 family lipoprotein n=1 Tax=unclassified Duganella TaxID=2636909 RepID=UPI0008AC0DF8|nr:MULTISPECIES: DUF6279 family lipoprotein [unclassified Duganella]RZT05618.1 hypothetical protein EV582_3933 [Duganella sp. BK701]SEM97239.1 hypothetical protein SAMN05216319_5086 [Duganella sp. CF402]
MQKSNMPPVGRRTLYGLFLIMLMTVLAGCSSLRLAYNNGDTLLYWWIDGYVDLNSDQKDWVRKDIDELFRWHRKTQLRDYMQILQTAQRQLAAGPTAADLHNDYDEIKDRTELLLFKALPELADLARSLQPDQIATLERKFAANTAEFRKKNMRGDREAQQKFRYQKSMEQFELWFGNFTSEQEAQIRKASDARPLDNALWLDERQRRQKMILTAVRKVQQDKLSKDATIALLHTLIKDSFDRMDQPSERKAFFDAAEEGNVQLILTVIQLATPAQKAHANKRMQGWIDDLKQLAAEQR